MNEPLDPNITADIPSSPADSLDAGLAAGFGRPAVAPRSSLGDLRPVLLKEAEGESGLVVKPKSDAMPSPAEAGDRYQLSGEIARGGMGAVLRGRDVDLGRDLAVKVLLEKYVHRPEVARRFIEEAQIGGQLQHPGVVPVYDFGHFGDRPFFTMKLVKGHTLAALLEERADPAADRPRFLGIAQQVANTLAYAHAKGVIHRDLKLANVMVGAFGEVQVMDWGLAKVLAEGGIADEERASRERQRPENVTTIRTARSTGSTGSFGTDTEAGSLLGTPAYMPPEQANGDIAHLDRRADVFGLGAILCEILTGQPPYVGRSAEEVRRKACNGDLADAITRLDTCGADQELITLTKACLSPEAIDRPKDARAVADGLTNYLNGVQERLRQAELAEAEAKAKAVEEAKRRRLTLALAGTILLAVTLGGGGWLWVKADHDARVAQVTRDVNDALNKATSVREQAKTANVGSAALFAQAREQAQRALALVENGPADDTLKAQVQRLKDELDEEEKDRTLITALDEARLAQAETLSQNRFANERAVPKFREAFATYGLPAGQGEPAAAAERIRQRPVAVQETILAALDEWCDLAGSRELQITEPHREWLRAVLSAAEPEAAWAWQVRAARAEKDPDKRRAALEQLAASADVAKTPARALTRLARKLDPAPQVALLRRAQAHYPAEFWVNHDLGRALQEITPPEYAESVRFLTAAAALHPNSPGCLMNLGIALWESGQVDEAIAWHQKALQIEPKYAAAHCNLAAALQDKGQLDEAIAGHRQAIELDPKSAEFHNGLGVALAVKGQVDGAIACYQKAIELNPKNAAAHSNLGNALKAKGQVDEAIACQRKAVALAPKYANAHQNLATALRAKGQVDEALASCQKAIELDPANANAHYTLGAILCDSKRDYDGAIGCFRRAIELKPNYATAYTGMGNALGHKGQLEEAVACHRRAIALEPKNAKAHRRLGNFLCDEKREYDAAIACFQRAIELEPKFAEAHCDLGVALYNKGQSDAAIPCFRKAIDLDPKLANAHNCLGGALGRKGQVDEAIACFKKAVELDPKDVRAHHNLGEALAGKGQLVEAISYYRRAITLDPRLPRAHLELGVALARTGQADEAIACVNKAIELDPKNAAAHSSLGAALCNLKGDFDGAIASFKKAIELDPKDAVAHFNLGNALRAKGRLDEAIASFKKAIELKPNFAGAHCNLGNALDTKGQADAAIASYRKAVELDPKDAQAHGALGLALLGQGHYAEAKDASARALALLPDRHPGRAFVSRQVQDCELFLILEVRLPRLIRGEDKANSAREGLDVAKMCHLKKMHAAATRFAAEAFAADPKLADDLQRAHRYNAACHAALAAAGKGEDAAKLDDKERMRLRKQALEWLKADLTAWGKLLDSGPPQTRPAVVNLLNQLQKNSELSSLRDAEALARFPKDEQKALTQLWADVAALLQKAEGKAK